MLAGVVGAIALAAVLALFNLRFRAHIFIAGIAVTFLAYGLTALLLKSVLGQDGVFTSAEHPRVSADPHPAHRRHAGARPAAQRPYAARLSRLSLRALRLVDALPDALGPARPHGRRGRGRGALRPAFRSTRIKFQTMAVSGLFCGLAGAYLSLGYVSLFAKQMTDERGLIALAAIFFAKGRPFPTTAVALLFGVATALSVRLPQVTGAAPQLLQMIPYVVTVLALVIVGLRAKRAGGHRRLALRDMTDNPYDNLNGEDLPWRNASSFSTSTPAPTTRWRSCARRFIPISISSPARPSTATSRLQYCTNNTLRALEFVGRGDVPVYEGLDRPLARPDFPVPRAQKFDNGVHGRELPIPNTTLAQAGHQRRRLPDRHLQEHDRRDRAHAGRAALQHCGGAGASIRSSSIACRK